MDVDDYLDGATVTVPAETYAVVQADRPDPDAFASIADGREITVVTESSAVDAAAAIDVQDGWRRLTFEVVLPFDLVGFLARVATALAAADVSIFALSAYSTDHVLVDEADLDTAVDVLEDLGCTVEYRPDGADR